MAMSSVFPAGTPQAEQKRTLADKSVPQDEHLGMKISRYRITQVRASGVRPRTSDVRFADLIRRSHPECSRFSGGAKDLRLTQPRALAKGPTPEVRRHFCITMQNE